MKVSGLNVAELLSVMMGCLDDLFFKILQFAASDHSHYDIPVVTTTTFDRLLRWVPLLERELTGKPDERLLEFYRNFLLNVRIGGKRDGVSMRVRHGEVGYICWWFCEARRGVGRLAIEDRWSCEEGEMDMCNRVSTVWTF
jgi:hypothetical protein